MSTISQLKNINLMTKSQFYSITPNDDELYCLQGHFVIEAYSTANYWYRKYSDGWIEQGGKVTITSSGAIVYPLAFKSPPIFLNPNPYNVPTNSTSDVNYVCRARNITSTGFTLDYYDSDTNETRTGICTWEAKGY